MGAVFSYALHKSNSLFVPILIHAILDGSRLIA